MKRVQITLLFLLAILAPRGAFANLTGPYTPDANTLFLLHLNEAAGNSVTTNVGSLGGNFISVNFGSAAAPLPVVTTMLGSASYSTTSPTSINFNLCENNTTGGYMFGYDYNRDGTFEGDTGSGTGADFITMSQLNIGNGKQTPFTLEAIIKPTSTAGNQEIICTDSDSPTRGFQFRISSGTLMFQFISTSQALSSTIPTSGANAFVANSWFHVAFTYDGTNGTLYWTALNPSMGAANVIGVNPMTLGTTSGSVTGPLCIGNRGRPTGTETFLGSIDEVRISNVARAANQMQFFSPLVTITASPISQNVDYNQPVTFSVGAATTGSTLEYQWLFNSNKVAGATNSVYYLPNVAATNAGYYACVVSNTAGNSATSGTAQLVVGAANFLYHRYSFINGANDSIGTANGTLYGDATAANGVLTLDGTTGTFMALPSGIINGANQTAFTIETWATYGQNPDDVYLFNFGTTNEAVPIAHAYLGYSPHNAAGQEIFISPGDADTFDQTATAPGVLDGLAMHVACVYDPPNKTMAIYTNGILEAVNTNMTVGMGNINDVYSFIGASLNYDDPFLTANINEVRLYSGALSPLSLEQSDLLGPTRVLSGGPATFVQQPVGTTTPVGETATLEAVATGYLPISYQWYKNGVLVPGATNAIYSFATALGNNGNTFYCKASNTIGVTTYVATSSTVTLSVFLPPTLSWLGTADGGANNTWDTSSLDWTNDLSGGGIIAFSQTNGVLFDDRSGGGAVDLEQVIIPYAVKVNAASGYAFTSSGQAGELAGLGSLLKQGSGTLQIDLTNNLSGAVTISAGELQIGNNDASGSLGTGTVTNNAILSLYRSDAALNVGNTIHGTGVLSMDGSGTVTVSGNSDYSGGTLINQGTLDLISGTGLGIGTATVANGAELYITASVSVPTPLTINGVGDGNGALELGGGGVGTYRGAIYLASDATIGVDAGATLVVSNAISGNANLTLAGAGTVTLAAPSSYTGGTTVAGNGNGTTFIVNVNDNNALGSGLAMIPSGVGGARFIIGSGLTITNAFDFGSVDPGYYLGILMVNDNTNNLVTTISGPVEFDDSPVEGGGLVGPTTSGYLNVTGPVTNFVTGVISARLGNIRFSGGGNYSTMTVNTGNDSIGANNGICSNAVLNMGASGIASFDLNGFNQTLAGLTDGSTYSELITNSATTLSTLTVDPASGLTFSGIISGNTALVMNGPGSQLLAATNTYTGNTKVNGGVLEFANPSFASASTVTITSGGVLQLDPATTNRVAGLVLNGVSQPNGFYSSANSSPYLAGSGILQVMQQTVATTPPKITFTASGHQLVLNWPSDHIGWQLQMQTNSLTGNHWVNVPGTTTVDGFTNSVFSTYNAVFYRLTYQ